MKLITALKNVDKTQHAQWIDADEVAQELGINRYDTPDNWYDRVKGYFIARWMCTDTMVGVCAIYLDDNLVGFYNQVGRKCDKDYEWLDLNSVDKMKEVLLENNCENFKFIDLSEEIAETHFVDFYSQLVDKQGFFNGNVAKVIGNGDKANCTSTKVLIETCNETLTVNTEDFKIPLLLNWDGQETGETNA